MLILTEYIVKHELKPLIDNLSLKDIFHAAIKVSKGLGIELKPPKAGYNFRYFKVRVGKGNQARMIVFMTSDNNKIVPVLIRLKKDKIFGMNMAMSNPNVVTQVSKNLEGVLHDIQDGNFQEFPF